MKKPRPDKACHARCDDLRDAIDSMLATLRQYPNINLRPFRGHGRWTDAVGLDSELEEKMPNDRRH